MVSKKIRIKRVFFFFFENKNKKRYIRNSQSKFNSFSKKNLSLILLMFISEFFTTLEKSSTLWKLLKKPLQGYNIVQYANFSLFNTLFL